MICASDLGLLDFPKHFPEADPRRVAISVTRTPEEAEKFEAIHRRLFPEPKAPPAPQPPKGAQHATSRVTKSKAKPIDRSENARKIWANPTTRQRIIAGKIESAARAKAAALAAETAAAERVAAVLASAPLVSPEITVGATPLAAPESPTTIPLTEPSETMSAGEPPPVYRPKVLAPSPPAKEPTPKQERMSAAASKSWATESIRAKMVAGLRAAFARRRALRAEAAAAANGVAL